MLLLYEEVDYEFLMPEVMDSLSNCLYYWYKQESRLGEIPNLYDLIFDQNEYGQMLFDTLAESMCWERHKLGLLPRPDGEDFKDEMYNMSMEELQDCWEYYHPKIVKDLFRVLKQKQLVFAFGEWKTLEEDISCYKNSPLQEVW